MHVELTIFLPLLQPQTSGTPGPSLAECRSTLCKAWLAQTLKCIVTGYSFVIVTTVLSLQLQAAASLDLCMFLLSSLPGHHIAYAQPKST